MEVGETLILAGDIGGTKSILGIFSVETGPRTPLAEATFVTAEHPSLEAMAAEFLSHVSYQVRSACFGIAGPVVEGRAIATNLPWKVEEKELSGTLSIHSVRLLNDLEAMALSIPLLEEEDFHVLSAGKPQQGGAIAVLAPGTGLGEAFLTWNGSEYLTHPSEGGHCDFAPRSTLEADLLRHMAELLPHVSYETVCSGKGLGNLYRYLRDSGQVEEPPQLAARMKSCSDPVPVILEGAMDRTPPLELCSRTLDLFLSILGAEAGNLALKVMATGGLYLGGGIPPRVLPALIDGPFMPAFLEKGRLAHVMKIIPVRVIKNPRAALMGAAHRGMGHRHAVSGMHGVR